MPPSPRDAAEAWLLGRINYERVAVLPYHARQLKLDRMRQLLVRLGLPDAALPIVHVAGTKGKGSTSAMLASVLTAAGYRVGVFSSPHLEAIEERFSIDAKPIDSQAFSELVSQVRPAVERLDHELVERMDRESDAEAGGSEEPTVGGPTFFDITTAMALVYFAAEACDLVILEVGLGGRLDSTNVCLPIVSVITSISLDHTRQLGDTLAKIAGEKAGIIKPGVPVVSGVTQSEPQSVIADIAKQRGCRLLQAERDFGHSQVESQSIDFWRLAGNERNEVHRLAVGLLGEHQLANASVALATIGELQGQGWEVSEQARRKGLQSVTAPGRVELLPGKPAVVIDTAHNRASVAALCRAIEDLPTHEFRTLVVAISRDKDVPAIVTELADRFDHTIVTRYVDNPRATPPDELAKLFAEQGVQATIEEEPVAAWNQALSITPSDGLVVVTGSFFIAAELRSQAIKHSQATCQSDHCGCD